MSVVSVFCANTRAIINSQNLTVVPQLQIKRILLTTKVAQKQVSHTITLNLLNTRHKFVHNSTGTAGSNVNYHNC